MQYIRDSIKDHVGHYLALCGTGSRIFFVNLYYNLKKSILQRIPQL